MLPGQAEIEIYLLVLFNDRVSDCHNEDANMVGYGNSDQQLTLLVYSPRLVRACPIECWIFTR